MTGPTNTEGRLVYGDARELEALPGGLPMPPRAIITSPPYWDLQDYESEQQVGHGQKLDEFLKDISVVLSACYRISASDATMWLVVGAIRRQGRLIALPALIAKLAEEANWVPRETITWSKGKSMPWTKHGQLRDVTEQILLFSKTSNYLFNVDALRSPDPSSRWWVRYPERYSPLGRAPTNVWDIAIPTQGAWKQGPRHACPFPQELTYRLITLVTRPGDVVLDPFAGVGSVPAMAEAMGRIGYGVEIAQRYIDQFDLARGEASAWVGHRKSASETSGRHAVFKTLIIQLRLLKFAKVLAGSLTKRGFGIAGVFVASSRRRPRLAHKIVCGKFQILLEDRPSAVEASVIIEGALELASSRPLSKFGIEPIFSIGAARDIDRARWFRRGEYWTPPLKAQPGEQGPHVASRFVPRIPIDDRRRSPKRPPSATGA